jgi:hypothetical protein
MSQEKESGIEVVADRGKYGVNVTPTPAVGQFSRVWTRRFMYSRVNLSGFNISFVTSN